MHGQQAHQTLLSAMTSPGKERTNAFGRMGLTFGLGFLLTPLLSIIATKLFSESAPIIVSAILCIVPVAVLECLLDKRSYEEHQSEVTEESNNHMSITNVIRILNRPGVLNIMFKKNAPIVPMLLTNGFGVIWMRKRFTEQTLLLIGMIFFVSLSFLYFGNEIC
ncbi:unnamed protein product [Cylicostephanus goldi]|uniref:Major facilitator superfamily associated domain-containing protein n=1 Tax=Cylicostephanus goldi TaxID=71465 RepID=A0A3P6R2W4_CYLGO|nr:unnamed protein product [Cylicostephanus goldi]